MAVEIFRSIRKFIFIVERRMLSEWIEKRLGLLVMLTIPGFIFSIFFAFLAMLFTPSWLWGNMEDIIGPTILAILILYSFVVNLKGYEE